MDVDNSGHVYVADTGNNCVEVFVVEAGLTDNHSMPRQLQLTYDYEQYFVSLLSLDLRRLVC